MGLSTTVSDDEGDAGTGTFVAGEIPYVMFKMGDGTKVAAQGTLVPASEGGWLEKVTSAVGLLIQFPGC